MTAGFVGASAVDAVSFVIRVTDTKPIPAEHGRRLALPLRGAQGANLERSDQ